MFHIHNGDSSAGSASESGLPGLHLGWHEALATGPAPQGLSPDEWRSVRARHLAALGGVDFKECQADLLRQEAALGSFGEHEEVVLWFGPDLYCQTLLASLLNWFSNRDLGSTRLSLICIGAFGGVERFKCLGQLSPAQMASLFDRRHQVTAAELRVGARAWAAYCSPDPAAVEDLLREANLAMPFLREALSYHLRRFPSVRNGLGCNANRILTRLSAGPTAFAGLWGATSDEEPASGLTDLELLAELRRLNAARVPVALANGAKSEGEPAGSQFRITPTGKRVLAGEEDFVRLNGIDLWLGGSHLAGAGGIWRWDQADSRIVCEVA